MKKKYRLQQKFAKRNSEKYARWFIENHEETLEKALQEKHQMSLKGMTENQKIEMVKNILIQVWKSILHVLYVERAEVYWGSKAPGVEHFLFAIIINKINYVSSRQKKEQSFNYDYTKINERKQKKKKYEKFNRGNVKTSSKRKDQMESPNKGQS